MMQARGRRDTRSSTLFAGAVRCPPARDTLQAITIQPSPDSPVQSWTRYSYLSGTLQAMGVEFSALLGVLERSGQRRGGSDDNAETWRQS